MGYALQQNVSKRLHRDMLAALDAVQAKYHGKLLRVWGDARRELRAEVWETYKRASPKGKWSLASLRRSGAADLFRMQSRGTLERYRATTTTLMREAFRVAHHQSVLRHAWILDQITPGKNTAIIPTSTRHREAAKPAADAPNWAERVTIWADEYNNALQSNLRMAAMSGTAMADAADEVDATKANTPAMGLWDAIARIYDTQLVAEIAAGEQEVAFANGDDVEEEIWRTRGDMTVCDTCEENEGQTPQTATSMLPAHPWCHCFWQIVPAEFAELLRSGDADDQELARMMDLKGLVPNSLVVRTAKGDVAGKAIITFQSWLSGQPQSVTGGLS